MCARTPRVTKVAPVQNATGLWKLMPEVTASDYGRGRCKGCNSGKAVGARGAMGAMGARGAVEADLQVGLSEVIRRVPPLPLDIAADTALLLLGSRPT